MSDPTNVNGIPVAGGPAQPVTLLNATLPPLPSLPNIPAGEAHIGQVGGHILLPTITFTLTAGAMDANDVLADTQELASALRVAGGSGVLHSITLLDEDDQTPAATTVYILKSNVSLGTEGAAVSITDANAREIIGRIDIAASDWTDLIAARLAFKANLGIPVKMASGTSLYVALVTAGTPTVTASGMRGVFGILAD